MHRLDTATRGIDENGAGKDGFTEGTPPMVPPSTAGKKWFNDVQETLCHPIEAAGLTLDDADPAQLTDAIEQLVADAIAPVTVDGSGNIAGAGNLTLSGEVLYTTPKTRVMYIPVAAGFRSTDGATQDWGVPGTVPTSAESLTTNADLFFDLSQVPNEATITKIRALVDPVTGMSMRAFRHTVSGTTISSTQTSLFSSSGASLQWIDSGTISLTGAASAWREMYVHASDVGEKVHVVEVTYTDFGPKNHT
jgi:hypothetical protein